MRFQAIATILVGSAAVPAAASPPEAWAELNRRVDRACVAMAGLARPQLLAAQLSYSDDVPVEVRLIRGTDNRGRAKRMICVYDRRTGRAEAQEAPNWLAPTVRP